MKQYFYIISFMLSMAYSFDFYQTRCIPQSCLENDKSCHETQKKMLQIDDIKDFSEIDYCNKVDIPGIFSDFTIDENTCICEGENKATYCFPFIQSPKNPIYPCSPKMLEYFKMKEYIKEFRCNQFKKNWNADRYPCIFDKDQKKIDECRQTLYEKYCK